VKVPTTKAQRHKVAQMPDAMIFVPSCLCGKALFSTVYNSNGEAATV